jgi:hypothetical protein
MAENWNEIFSNDIRELCQMNSMKCYEMDKLELSKAWNLIGICLGDLNINFPKLKTWNVHPLGKGLAIRLLKQFEE